MFFNQTRFLSLSHSGRLLPSSSSSSSFLQQSQPFVLKNSTQLISPFFPRRYFLSSITKHFVAVVPEGEEWELYRMGRFKKTLKGGQFNFLLPFLDRIIYKYPTKIQQLEVQQELFTKDRKPVTLVSSTHYKVISRKDSTVDDPIYSLNTLIEHLLHKYSATLTFDELLSGQTKLTENIEAELSKKVLEFGLECVRFEPRGIRGTEELQKVLKEESLQKMQESQKKEEIEVEKLKLEMIALTQRDAAMIRTQTIKEQIKELLPLLSPTETVKFALAQDLISILRETQLKNSSYQRIASTSSTTTTTTPSSSPSTVEEKDIGELVKEAEKLFDDVSNFLDRASSAFPVTGEESNKKQNTSENSGLSPTFEDKTSNQKST